MLNTKFYKSIIQHIVDLFLVTLFHAQYLFLQCKKAKVLTLAFLFSNWLNNKGMVTFISRKFASIHNWSPFLVLTF